jgi:RNA polymerase sigma-70 factor (ECF subfamily)
MSWEQACACSKLKIRYNRRVHADVEKALEALRTGEPGALERALGQLQQTVFSFSMRLCGHREDAEDTMQNTLLKAAQHLQKFSSARALGVWLYKVAKNCCLMSRRRSKFAPREQLSLEALMPDRSELERLAAAGTPEKDFLRRESAERLRAAIAKLPPEHRLVLVLHDMEGLSDEEIAEVTGLKRGNVRVRLHRARLFVRNELAVAKRTARKLPAAAMKCKDLFARLSDYLDGEISDVYCDRIEQHLESCAPCQVFLESLRQTVEQVRRQPREQLDARRAAEARGRLAAAYRQALAELGLRAEAKSGL